jgi:hypothetical protein
LSVIQNLITTKKIFVNVSHNPPLIFHQKLNQLVDETIWILSFRCNLLFWYFVQFNSRAKSFSNIVMFKERMSEIISAERIRAKIVPLRLRPRRDGPKWYHNNRKLHCIILLYSGSKWKRTGQSNN